MAPRAAVRFRELFDDHARDVLGYALRRVDVPADAADVVAETFLIAWRRIDDVPPGGEARPWLFGVARRVLANRRRSERRRRRLGMKLRSQLGSLLAPAADEPVGDRRLVQLALARLPDGDAELLRLTAWEGLTPSELAVALGLPPATVRSRLLRARRRLRAELEAGGWPASRDAAAGHVPDDGRPPVRDHEEER